MDCLTNDGKFACCLYDLPYSLSQTRALQTNDYDCGLWVLASIAAVIQGHDAMGLVESDMPAFRRYLQACVLSIPVA